MFVSYAQNFEDVILWRALKQVTNGFYVDIGAQDPNVDSVSKGFYEKGWRGMHVEPTAVYSKKLRDARDGEEVVEAAIGLGDEPIDFYEIPETGLSTGSAEFAEMHRNNNFMVMKRSVTQMRLSALFDRIGDRDIHWLKIDVEGMEREVIESWSPSRSRPWVVVVESTLPNTQVATFSEWEPQLLHFGYEYVYFDGLNRFYVHSSRSEYKKFFGPGPNVFDNFALFGNSSTSVLSLYDERIRQRDHRLAECSVRIGELGGELETKEAAIQKSALRTAELEHKLAELERKFAERDAELRKVHLGWLWKLDKSLRRVERAIRRPVKAAKTFTRSLLSKANRMTSRRARRRAASEPVPAPSQPPLSAPAVRSYRRLVQTASQATKD